MRDSNSAAPALGGAQRMNTQSVADSTALHQRRDRQQILQSFGDELDQLVADLSAWGLTQEEAETNVTAFVRRMLPVLGEVGVWVDRASLRQMYGKPAVQRTAHTLVAQILQTDGIHMRLSGYTYLCEAIARVAEDRGRLRDMMGLYSDVALQHGTTASRVERAIRHAIATSDAAGDRHGRLPNSEYIARVAERLRVGI